MALTMQTEFTEWDIEDLQVLRSGTVYKLTGHMGEVLIIKGESANIQQSSLQHSKVAMKAVDKVGGHVKALSTAEKKALQDWIANSAKPSPGWKPARSMPCGKSSRT
jgi:hypothetical protein